MRVSVSKQTIRHCLAGLVLLLYGAVGGSVIGWYCGFAAGFQHSEETINERGGMSPGRKKELIKIGKEALERRKKNGRLY